MHIWGYAEYVPGLFTFYAVIRKKVEAEIIPRGVAGTNWRGTAA